MTKVLKNGDVFYCKSQSGSYRSYKFLNVVTNHKKNRCMNCTSKGSRYCCRMFYSLTEDPADINHICLNNCIDMMYHDQTKESAVKYIENLFEPQDDDIVITEPIEPVPQLNTVEPVIRATRYRTHTPNFTSAHSNFYNSNFVTANLETSERFRAVFTGIT